MDPKNLGEDSQGIESCSSSALLRECTHKKTPEEKKEPELSPTWPEDSVQDILDYIEEQGIYIRE